jgi:hypothetical protein
MAKPMDYSKYGGYVYLAKERNSKDSEFLYKCGMSRKNAYTRVQSINSKTGLDLLVVDFFVSLNVFYDEKITREILLSFGRFSHGEYFLSKNEEDVENAFYDIRDEKHDIWRNIVRGNYALLQS